MEILPAAGLIVRDRLEWAENRDCQGSPFNAKLFHPKVGSAPSAEFWHHCSKWSALNKSQATDPIDGFAELDGVDLQDPVGLGLKRCDSGGHEAPPAPAGTG